MFDNVQKVDSYKKFHEVLSQNENVVLTIYSEKKDQWKKLNPKYCEIIGDFSGDNIKFIKFPSEKIEYENRKGIEIKKAEKEKEIKDKDKRNGIDSSEPVQDEDGYLSLEHVPIFVFYKDQKEMDSTYKVLEGIIRKKIRTLIGKKLENQLIDISDYEKAIQSNEYIIIEFITSWCGGCLRVEPFLQKLIKEYSMVKLFRVDIEDSKLLGNKLGVEIFPTFLFIKNGFEIRRMRGEKSGRLLDCIEELVPSAGTGKSYKSKTHDHFLYKKRKYDMVCDTCYACYYDKFTFGYYCSKCKYTMCQDCVDMEKKGIPLKKAAVLETFQYHEHPIFRVKEYCRCNVCKEATNDSYCCRRCDFHMCEKCLNINSKNDETEACGGCLIF